MGTKNTIVLDDIFFLPFFLALNNSSPSPLRELAKASGSSAAPTLTPCDDTSNGAERPPRPHVLPGSQGCLSIVNVLKHVANLTGKETW